MEVTKFATICVPSEDVDIDNEMLRLYTESIYQNYYSGFGAQSIIHLAHNRSLDDDSLVRYQSWRMAKHQWEGRRDYYKIEYFTQVINSVFRENEVIAFMDVDTIITKPIELPDDDWDFIFTLRHPWIGGSHFVNLGVWFANVTPENKHRISWFMQTWLHTPLPGMANDWANHYRKYMKGEDIKSHSEGNFEFDRIVSQSVINSFCAYDWTGAGDYNWDGVKIKIVDEHYNCPWKYDDPIRDDVYVYHLKGVREAKTIRAKYLMEKIYNV